MTAQQRIAQATEAPLGQRLELELAGPAERRPRSAGPGS